MLSRRRAAVTAIALFVALAAAPALADRSVSVGTANESWYFTAPSTPVTTPADAPAASPYPGGTLHVGVTAGQEDSRTYISLDFGELPFDAEITGGTLLLPVAADGGTRSVEAARLRVCRSEAPGDDVRGSTAPPPATDCSMSSDAEYDEATKTFTADLEPLVGFLDGGLAIVPKPPTTDETWHVAFHARDRDTEGATPITARLTIEEDPTDTFQAPPFFDSESFAADIHPESAVESSPPPPLLGGGAPSTPAPRDEAAAPATGNSDRPVVGQTIALGTSDGFKYSVIFGLPLLLLVAVPYFGQALTAPLPARSPREPG